MKYILLLIALFGSALLNAGEADILEQRLIWKGAMPTKSHEGTLTISALQVVADDTVQELSVVVDMTSMTNTDIKKEKSRTKLLKHLMSEDFFHVEEYPTATFTFAESTPEGMTGTLNIRGVEKEQTVPVSLTRQDDGSWKLAGSFTFDRQAFGVNYQTAGLFGSAKNKLIDDEVEVSVDVVFTVAD